MRSYFLTLAFIATFSFSAFAQKRIEEIKQLMWASDDAGFKATEVPDKWKNESAVILCQSNYFEYRKEALFNYLYQKEYSHQRVKLLDKSALEEYSELSYRSGGDFFFGVKTIKPSGKEMVIDLKEAVEMEQAVDGAYGSTYTLKYYKIAIPSLEVGDIIDYYACMEKTIDVPLKIYTFSDVIYTLQSKYPILKQSLEFKLQRRCFLNIKEYNNAPQLKMKEDPKGDAVVYSMVDKDREKVADKIWHYPYRSVPTIKFQVRYAAPSREGIFDFLGEPTVPKTSITKEELIAYVNKQITGRTFFASYYLKPYMQKKFGKEKDPDKIVEAAYYYTRYNSPNSPMDFVQGMSSILKSKKIPHQVLITIPRTISTLDDAVMEDEFTYLIKVNTAKPYFITAPGRHTLMKDLDPRLQGVEAYGINQMDKKLRKTAERIKIPVTPHTENNSTQKITVSVNEDFSAVKSTVEVILKGENKADGQLNLLIPMDYKEEEYTRLKEKNPSKANDMTLKTKVREDYRKKEEREKEESIKAREDALKPQAEEEYDAKILSVKNFTIKQNGRWMDQPEMIYSQEIEMEGLLKKVGPNYILEAGKLIGKQIELTEDDKDRKLDVFMPYARSYNNEISIAIPEGYKVEGLENFNINTTTKAGGFVSSAKLAGDKVVITTSKYYVNNFEKAEDWKQLEDFLEAAYKFTQQKLLLKKK